MRMFLIHTLAVSPYSHTYVDGSPGKRPNNHFSAAVVCALLLSPNAGLSPHESTIGTLSTFTVSSSNLQLSACYDRRSAICSRVKRVIYVFRSCITSQSSSVEDSAQGTDILSCRHQLSFSANIRRQIGGAGHPSNSRILPRVRTFLDLIGRGTESSSSLSMSLHRRSCTGVGCSAY